MSNKYIKHTNIPLDQALLQRLNTESIHTMGIDLWYLPRKVTNLDTIYGEDRFSIFDSAYPIEIYIGNGGSPTQNTDILLSKFGLVQQEQITLQISIEFFNRTLGHRRQRPTEGDLIYAPFNDSLYEITYVEHDNIYFQLGRIYVYTLEIDLWDYNNQQLRTGKPEIDKFENLYQGGVKLEFNDSDGYFSKNDIVYQGESLESALIKGTVLQYSCITNIAHIGNINSGEKFQEKSAKFDIGLPVKSTKGIIKTIKVADENASNSIDVNEFQNSPTQIIADNYKLKTETIPILRGDKVDAYGRRI